MTNTAKSDEFELDCWRCERLVSDEDNLSFWETLLKALDIFSWLAPPSRVVFFVDPQEDCSICHGYGYVFHNGGNYRAPDESHCA